MEREAVLVGIDVGTSKTCALIGEVGRDGRLTIMGHGTVPSSGLKKGGIVNIEQTVRSIADAVERAERLSGWKIDRAFVGVGGVSVESLNSTGQVAVTAHSREVTHEDINRAIEVARAVSIPSNRRELHVERRGFTVDGQEGVRDPIGMSALRLEVEAHIVTASATAIQNLSKCVELAGVKIDELVVDALASGEAVLTDTEKELGVAVADIGAGTIDLALFADGSPFHTAVLPIGGNNVTNDIAVGVKTTLQVAEELKIRHGTCDLRNLEDEEISVSVSTASADASPLPTSSSILTPASWTHLVRFWTAVADADTMWASTSSRSALMPSGSLTPSWPSTVKPRRSTWSTSRLLGIDTALATSMARFTSSRVTSRW